MFSNTDIDSIVKFDANTGKITLKDQRMILVGTDALGNLRRDLIASVGMDRAKTILLRYGRYYGAEFAKNLKALFPFESPTEWFHAGPQVHRITGSVLVQLAQLTYNNDNGDYLGEGYWYNSYEAEQHLKHFGVNEEPVCHTLSGFVGGYATEHYGSEIVVREIKCVGKGDEYCYWVAKPKDDWDEDEIHGELDEDYEVMTETKNTMLHIEKQKDVLKKALKLNERLSNVLIQGQGLSKIVSVLGQTLNLAILIEDKDFNLLDSYSLFKKHDMLDIIKFKSQYTLTNQLEEAKGPIHFTITEGSGWSHERLICPIYTKNGLFGYISLVKEVGEFDEIEIVSLETAARICSIQLLQDMTAIETEQRLKGELINEILSDKCKEETLSYRTKLMGYNFSRPHSIFILKVDSSIDQTEEVIEKYGSSIKKTITETINSHLKNFGSSQQIFITNIDGYIVMFIPMEVIDQLGMTKKTFSTLFLNALQNKYKILTFRIGISSICEKITDYRKGYEEAIKAIEISSIRKNKESILAFEELGTFSKLFSLENVEELKELANSLLLPLKYYDEKNKSELLITLYHYLENQGNIQKTSEALLLSLGATRYRLKRIQEVSEIDLTNAKDFYEAHLAMQIYIFMGTVHF